MKSKNTRKKLKAASYILLTILLLIPSYKLYNIRTSQKRNAVEAIKSLQDYNANLEKEKEHYAGVTDSTKIGAIHIPAINLTLSLFDYASEKALNNGVGYFNVFNYDVPVILGHSGEPNNILFTNLPKLKMGDYFYIQKDNGGIKEYKIVQQDTVKEEYAEDFLTNYKVKNNKESTLLWTCVPVHVNTHRFVLRGEFTRFVMAEDAQSAKVVLSDQEIAYIITIAMSLICILIFAIKDFKLLKKKQGA